MITQIDYELKRQGYTYLKVQPNEIGVYYKIDEDSVRVFMGLADHVDFSTSKEQLLAMFRKIREIFQNPYGKIDNFPANLYVTQVFMQMVVLTDRPNYYKEMVQSVSGIWILDTTADRLIIYENQVGDFFGLRKLLEHIISEKEKMNGQEKRHFEDLQGQGESGSWISNWIKTTFTRPKLTKQSLMYRPNGKPRAIVNTSIVMINILIYIILSFQGDTTSAQFIYDHGGLYPQAVIIGHEWYRLFTSMFLHIGFLHLSNNMFILFFIGDKLELAVGKVKYLLIYILSGLGGGLLSLAISVINGQNPVSAGASGAIFGVIGALLWLVLKNRGRFEELTSRGMAIMILLCLYFGFASTGVDNWCHVGGLISGFFLSILCYHPKQHR